MSLARTDPAVRLQSTSQVKIALFRSLFRGREDVYARRFESRETGRSGYAPASANLITAATALHHGLTIVSRDTGEYELANVLVLNPWTP